MNRTLPLLLLFVTFSHAASPTYFGLPWGAVIIETSALPSEVHPDRALVLWMRSPERHEKTDDLYTCPEETLGSYFEGPTRVSLVNTATRRVINTVPIRWNWHGAKDQFTIPYRIRGTYYHVPTFDDNREGKPHLLYLRDFNGDGKALESALYEALFCMGLNTTLYGYSVKQDRVIQYHVELENPDTGEKQDSISVDYLFAEKQDAPGHWEYRIDYRGRGGCLDQYEVWYESKNERFRGTLKSSPCAQTPPEN